jgi:hypothetical protein
MTRVCMQAVGASESVEPSVKRRKTAAADAEAEPDPNDVSMQVTGVMTMSLLLVSQCTA